jgi:hypothetical protein
MSTRLLCAVVVIGLGACDGDSGGFASSNTCGIDTAMSGGLEAHFDHEVGVACLTELSTASSGGVDGEIVPIDDPSGLHGVEIELPTLMRGMTGATTADITLRTADDIWQVAGCGALVHEHRELGAAELGTRYRIHATVTCTASATSDNTALAPIALGPLEFIYPITWVE